MPIDPREPELTLGAALRAAREQAGLTVEKLASETKIRATLIRDLEAEQFASSGGNVYARGHLKSIATSLHVDPAPLLAMFDRLAGAPASLAVAQTEQVTPSFGGTDFAISAAAALRPERRGPRWGVALSGAAAVLLVLVGIGSLSGDKGGDETVTGLGTPVATTAAPVVTVAPTQPPELLASKPPVVGAQLRVRVIGASSWVSISNASKTLFEGILKDGQHQDFSDATRLKVVIGFAPSVSLNCGGKDSGSTAAAGTVRRFECTQTGLKSL